MFELAQGCILVASWVKSAHFSPLVAPRLGANRSTTSALSCPLLAVEIFECVKYFRRFPGDVKAYQVAVVLALAIDVATVIRCAPSRLSIGY